MLNTNEGWSPDDQNTPLNSSWGVARLTSKVMAVAWRRARTPSLDSQKWTVLTIGGEQYLIKALFEDHGYHVMISDLSTVWEEDIGAERILRKGKVREVRQRG